MQVGYSLGFGRGHRLGRGIGIIGEIPRCRLKYQVVLVSLGHQPFACCLEVVRDTKIITATRDARDAFAVIGTGRAVRRDPVRITISEV